MPITRKDEQSSFWHRHYMCNAVGGSGEQAGTIDMGV